MDEPLAINTISQSTLTQAEGQPRPESRRLGSTIPYELFLDCVHCGLCTAACPTFLELGDENDSPRGRIYLMRAMVDGRIEPTEQVLRHLQRCLDCRACETACPSGVQYGRLLEPFRAELQLLGRTDSRIPPLLGPLERWVLGRVLPRRVLLRLALGLAQAARFTGLEQALGKLGLLRLLPRVLRRMHQQLPRFRYFVRCLPRLLPAHGARRARVALFTGCVADVLFRTAHWATARVLQRNGCEVIVPRGQVCCGALPYHAGLLESTVPLIRQNLAVFDRLDVDAIVVNVAGCGSLLKDYGHAVQEAVGLLDSRHAAGLDPDQAARVACRVRDVTEFLAELGPIAPQGPLPLRAVYHDACHLSHAQKIRSQPRQLLQMIPELKLLPLEESEICCGAAGAYALTQPELSDRLAQRKAEHILASRAQAVFTANAGCLIQIDQALRRTGHWLWVAHPIEALDRSYQHLPPPLPGE